MAIHGWMQTQCSWSNGSAYFLPPGSKDWSTKDPSGQNSGKAWYIVPPEQEAKYPLPDNQTADFAVATLERLAREKKAGDTRPFFLAVGFHKPHLPFVASKQFFDHYPPTAIQLPPDHEMPPKDMPAVAWSSYGELRAYADQVKLKATGAPGTKLPDDDVLALRRAYYAAVSQVRAQC